VTRLLLASNVAPLIAEDNLTEAAQFSQRFYSTSSVRYMLYADKAKKSFRTSLWESRCKTPSPLSVGFSQTITPPIPKCLWWQHLTPDGEVTDVFVPLLNDNYLGF